MVCYYNEDSNSKLFQRDEGIVENDGFNVKRNGVSEK
jgi:hypothetical protein